MVKYMLYICIISCHYLSHILIGEAHVVMVAPRGVKDWAAGAIQDLPKSAIDEDHVAGKGIGLERTASIASLRVLLVLYTRMDVKRYDIYDTRDPFDFTSSVKGTNL